MQVNRYLKNKPMDHIDHALGRPVYPLEETYRNHFAVTEGGPHDQEFAQSPHWRLESRSSGMVSYQVTHAGRLALKDHLAQIGERHRMFAITFWGETVHVVGKSHGDAKYSFWLDLSDSYSELTFGEFLKGASARVLA